MTISMDALIVGEEYERPYLAALWGYKDWHAIGKGVITPAGADVIVLFVTRDKQNSLTQYHDYFDGDVLHMEGESKGSSDQRIIVAGRRGSPIYLFFRIRHHQPFTYFGPVALLSAEDRNGTQPSRFTFSTQRSEAIADSSLRTEQVAHGVVNETFIPDDEGYRRLRQHVTHERSRRNRARAIAIHGTICMACGFDFNMVYGPELARDYIEIHHVKPLADNEGAVNPATDLLPLCSNCHSMAHRKRNLVVAIDELKKLIEERCGRTQSP